MGAVKESMVYASLLDRRRIGEDDYDDFFLECRILALTSRVIGMSSEVYKDNEKSGLHVFMMDTIPLNAEEYRELYNTLELLSRMEQWIIVFIRSSRKESDMHSYHVIIPHPFRPQQIRELTLSRFHRFADILFLGLGEKRNMWDLRISSKGKGDGDCPTLIRAFQPYVTNRPTSLVHLDIMDTYLPITFCKTTNNIYNQGSLNRILLRYSVTP